jgi:hypothetical protein
MAMKYWKLNFRKEMGVGDIESIVGRTGGNVIRVDYADGETRVYFAADESIEVTQYEAVGVTMSPQPVSEKEALTID